MQPSCTLVLALELRDVPEVVERPADTLSVPQLTEHRQRLLDERHGPRGVLLHNRDLSQSDQRPSDASFVSEFPAERQALLQPQAGRGKVAVLARQPPQPVERVGTPSEVSKFLEESQAVSYVRLPGSIVTTLHGEIFPQVQ